MTVFWHKLPPADTSTAGIAEQMAQRAHWGFEAPFDHEWSAHWGYLYADSSTWAENTPATATWAADSPTTPTWTERTPVSA